VDGENISEDELLLRLFAGTKVTDLLRSSPGTGAWFNGKTSWFSLLDKLMQDTSYRQVHVQRGSSSLYVERRAGSSTS
jgi:hypothetical protein